MDLLREILRWTGGLPLWQRDAVRRLLQRKDGLSNDDFAELYSLLKAEHGLPNPRELKPIPLSAGHIPAAPQSGETVILKAIKNLKYVNRIAPNQRLNFAPSGMTVIYGGNASGKSGYTRVMKRACRARDQEEKVHTDAYDPSTQNCIPEAIFEIEINGTPKQVRWTSDSDSPDELATIAVFDWRCARSYLTAEKNVAYLPYGLDVVENLANTVLPELTRRLEEEIAAINTDTRQFEHLLGDTEVGKLIASLGHDTDPDDVETLGTLTEDEKKRVVELKQALSEPDPTVKARELRLSARRIKGLAERIDSALAFVNDDAVSECKDVDEELTLANENEKQAAVALQSNKSLLPGTGERVWKAMFEAARKFSTEIAYPDHEFPHTAEGAVCPLCQQPLGEAGDRLKRFDEYVKNDVAEAARLQRQKTNAKKTEIERADLSFSLEESLADELEQHNGTVVAATRDYQASINARREWILTAFETHEWDKAPDLTASPRQRLRNIAASQYRAARIYDRAADTAKSKTLKAEREELSARQNLSKCIKAVLVLIESMKKKHALEACKGNLKTRPISDKSKEFASSVVTDAISKALDDEFQALGIGHISPSYRIDKARIMYKLRLEVPIKKKLEEILSEGEQRAIALGSFLAELKLANHTGGIIFDDPVSSLDHIWRRYVAKRLVEESSRRQVIVFTHDTTFLGQLRDQEDFRENPDNHLIQFLEWKGGKPGFVNDGLPWGHKSYKERLDFLEKEHKRLEDLPWPQYPNDEESAEMRKAYNHLRATIERVIQDVALNGVIRRFRDWVRVDSLESVACLVDSDCKEIARLYQHCSTVVDSHDPSSDKNDPVPTATKLGEDIDDLKNVIKAIKDSRRKI